MRQFARAAARIEGERFLLRLYNASATADSIPVGMVSNWGNGCGQKEWRKESRVSGGAFPGCPTYPFRDIKSDLKAILTPNHYSVHPPHRR